MTDQLVIDLGSKAIMIAMQVAAPALIATLIIGVLVSIFQAATQINEPTLTFVPKILAITVALVVMGPWILEVMTGFTHELYSGIPDITH